MQNIALIVILCMNGHFLAGIRQIIAKIRGIQTTYLQLYLVQCDLACTNTVDSMVSIWLQPHSWSATSAENVKLYVSIFHGLTSCRSVPLQLVTWIIFRLTRAQNLNKLWYVLSSPLFSDMLLVLTLVSESGGVKTSAEVVTLLLVVISRRV